MSAPCLGELLDGLVAEGLLTASARAQALDRAAAHEPAPALLTRTMTALGAWIAACAFMGSIAACAALIGVDDEEALALIGGVLLVGTTVASHPARGGRFLRHLVLAGTLAGKLAFYGGIAGVLHDEDGTALVVLITSAALALLHADGVERTLALVIGQFAIAFLLRDHPSAGVPVVTLVGLGLLLTAWGAPERPAPPLLSRLRDPLAWGGLIGLLVVRGGLAVAAEEDRDAPPLLGLVTPLLLAGALVGVVLWALGRVDLGARRGELAILLGGVVVGLALLSGTEPGILAGLIGVVVSFDQRARARLALSLLALAGFGVRFYYELDLDFLAKAGVLAGSGGLLLLLRAAVRRRFAGEAA